MDFTIFILVFINLSTNMMGEGGKNNNQKNNLTRKDFHMRPLIMALENLLLEQGNSAVISSPP